jgi:hypothetical protein
VGEQLVALESPVEGDHEQEPPPEPESPFELPAQIVPEPEATAVGIGLTVTETGLEIPEQPLEFVTVTVKLPDAVTLIVRVVAPPGDQR